MGEQNDTLKLVIQSVSNYYKETQKDPHGSYHSWEYCYSCFREARTQNNPNFDYLSLQLSCYLASWGMYRGSSFLLKKDYKIHIDIIKKLLNKKYDPLFGIICKDFRIEENQKLLEELNDLLNGYYEDVRNSVIKGRDIKSPVSSTLITKIIMGTMGCVPAYDRYFIDGIKRTKLTTGNYNINSILKLAKFYEDNNDALEEVRHGLKFGEIQYPQMKLLDMGFWKIGLDADKEKSDS